MTQPYQLNGKPVPSVTTILAIVRKEGLERWRGKLGNEECDRISKEATDFGTKLHSDLEWFNRDPDFIGSWGSPECRPYLEGYRQWHLEHVAEVILTERPLVCQCGHAFGGTLDVALLLKDQELPTVVDFKSSKQSEPSFGWQTAAYRHLLKCALGIDTSEQRLVLRFDKLHPGRIEEHWFENAAADWRVFLACSIVWHALQPTTNGQMLSRPTPTAPGACPEGGER